MTPRRRAVFLLEEAWGVVLRKGTYPKTWRTAPPAGKAATKGKPAHE